MTSEISETQGDPHDALMRRFCVGTTAKMVGGKKMGVDLRRLANFHQNGQCIDRIDPLDIF